MGETSSLSLKSVGQGERREGDDQKDYDNHQEE